MEQLGCHWTGCCDEGRYTCVDWAYLVFGFWSTKLHGVTLLVILSENAVPDCQQLHRYEHLNP
jgi:hypothetical protein